MKVSLTLEREHMVRDIYLSHKIICLIFQIKDLQRVLLLLTMLCVLVSYVYNIAVRSYCNLLHLFSFQEHQRVAS